MGKRLIYVEDAIEALHDEIVRRRIDENTNDDGALDEFDTEAILRRLPSAQPQRMRGEWIEDGYNHYKAVCSECGEPCATYVMGKPRDRFCKWCGADMRGDNNAAD